MFFALWGETNEIKAEHKKSIRRTLGSPAESAGDQIGANA
jgi:hypothetical protein